MKNRNSLKDKRFYKVKNPQREFFCALCRAPRQMKYGRNLQGRHFLQIVLLSIIASWLLFPWFKEKSLISFFFVWIVYELVHKFLYRRELPCPYCGFDATWYRRDVNVAKRLVEEFWLGVNEQEKEAVSQVQNLENLPTPTEEMSQGA